MNRPNTSCQRRRAVMCIVLKLICVDLVSAYTVFFSYLGNVFKSPPHSQGRNSRQIDFQPQLTQCHAIGNIGILHHFREFFEADLPIPIFICLHDCLIDNLIPPEKSAIRFCLIKPLTHPNQSLSLASGDERTCCSC